ncbi:MAG: hypothetical protein HOP14_12010 [Acidobacteria bacterium]|nr:hypothetical protein [Acidobacteriota bacterium]
MMTLEHLAEERQPVWIVPAPLVVWALHFLACYVTAALWCGPAVGTAPGGAALGNTALAGLPLALFTIYTLASMLALLALIRMGYRAHTLGDASPPHDADSPADRHRFIGYATLLIAGLSLVAVIYSAMAVFMVQTCQ